MSQSYQNENEIKVEIKEEKQPENRVIFAIKSPSQAGWLSNNAVSIPYTDITDHDRLIYTRGNPTPNDPKYNYFTVLGDTQFRLELGHASETEQYLLERSTLLYETENIQRFSEHSGNGLECLLTIIFLSLYYAEWNEKNYPKPLSSWLLISFFGRPACLTLGRLIMLRNQFSAFPQYLVVTFMSIWGIVGLDWIFDCWPACTIQDKNMTVYCLLLASYYIYKYAGALVVSAFGILFGLFFGFYLCVTDIWVYGRDAAKKRKRAKTLKDMFSYVGKVTDSEATCTVCLEDIKAGDDLRKLNCNHLFHKSCVDNWLTTTNKCPNCRAEVIAS